MSFSSGPGLRGDSELTRSCHQQNQEAEILGKDEFPSIIIWMNAMNAAW
jgi:hypothetical protein